MEQHYFLSLLLYFYILTQTLITVKNFRYRECFQNFKIYIISDFSNILLFQPNIIEI